MCRTHQVSKTARPGPPAYQALHFIRATSTGITETIQQKELKRRPPRHDQTYPRQPQKPRSLRPSKKMRS